MCKTTVINIRNDKRYDVYIGRPSKWGNPFVIGRDGTREQVIKKYRDWIATRPELLARSCTVTVDRRIAPPTAASERSMIVSCHAAPQCSDTCHAYLPGGVQLGPGFSRRGSVHVRLGDWHSGNLVASR